MGPPTKRRRIDQHQQHKRRKPDDQPQEITFNLSARHEYLTGFHKRKVQRAKQAQEAVERRVREERIRERKKIRDERKADLERHVAEVNALSRPVINNEDEDEDEKEHENGHKTIIEGEQQQPQEETPEPVDHEAEYIDEDKYTTVIVETVEVSRDGLAKLGGTDIDDASSNDEQTQKSAENNHEEVEGRKHRSTDGRASKRPADKLRKAQSKLAKQKKKNFRYESKTERKAARSKVRLKNSKQANARRAG